jgi:uncharacterized protein (TIGR04222 family)
MTGLNPLDWYGGAFLALYAALFVGALLAGGAIAARLRPDGCEVPTSNEEELAVLAGGAPRLTETVVSRLLARGEASIEGGRVMLGRASSGTSAIEREVTALPSPAKLNAIQRCVMAASKRIEDQLIARGLLMERGERRMLGLYAAAPLLLLIALGLAKFQVGVARDRPVGFLTAFLVVTVIAALIRVFVTAPHTKGGMAALRQARGRSARLQIAPTHDEMGTAVALYGTAVLVGSPMADLHRMRQGSGDGGGTTGDSSSGGDGGGDGGGGGGCGGCGGGS